VRKMECAGGEEDGGGAPEVRKTGGVATEEIW